MFLCCGWQIQEFKGRVSCIRMLLCLLMLACHWKPALQPTMHRAFPYPHSKILFSLQLCSFFCLFPRQFILLGFWWDLASRSCFSCLWIMSEFLLNDVKFTTEQLYLMDQWSLLNEFPRKQKKDTLSFLENVRLGKHQVGLTWTATCKSRISLKDGVIWRPLTFSWD